MSCDNVNIVVEEQVNVSVGLSEAPTWDEITVSVDSPTNTVQHDKAKLANIKKMMVVDGVPMRWAKVGITRDQASGTFTFPFLVQEEIIFEAK